MSLLPSGSLEITTVNIGDRAAYSCAVPDDSGGGGAALTSKPADLRLNMDLSVSHTPAPPVFLTVATSIKALAGATVTLECAANGVPSPTLTWLKDGVALNLDHASENNNTATAMTTTTADGGGGHRPGPRYARTGHGSLVIRDLVPADRGAYQCRAENAEDTEDSGLELQVLVPPAFTRRPTHYEAAEKEDILLECEATGVPAPEVTWYKNGDLIIQSEYFQVEKTGGELH
jgi:hypothetical protein